MNDDDNDNINDFLPSILNPRTIKKENVFLTQNSVISRCSLSLRRNHEQSKWSSKKDTPVKKQPLKNHATKQTSCLNSTASKISSLYKEKDLVVFDETNKENNSNLNTTDTIITTKRHDFLTFFDLANASTVDLLSLEDHIVTSPLLKSNNNVVNWDLRNQFITSVPKKTKVTEDQTSLDFSLFEELADN